LKEDGKLSIVATGGGGKTSSDSGNGSSENEQASNKNGHMGIELEVVLPIPNVTPHSGMRLIIPNGNSRDRSSLSK
jgi:hypothetical protein